MNSELGFCHGCGEPWTKLTYEHVPPDRVQKLIPESYLKFNTIDPILGRGDKANKKLPPAVFARGGLKVKSFGRCCQESTARNYGQQFYDWSRLFLEISEKIIPTEDRVQVTVEVEPLAVLKQVATIALATAAFNPHKTDATLRRFIQNPALTGRVPNLNFYAYLNPIRSDYRLPQCRLWRKVAVINGFLDRTSTMIYAEVSVPPLGYVITYQMPGNQASSVEALAPISHFAEVPFGQRVTVALDMPVRTPFGPFFLRYWQDALNDPRDVVAEASSPV